MRKSILTLTLVPLLAACAAAPRPTPGTTPAPVAQTAPPPHQSRPAPPVPGFRAPRVMQMPGLEDVIGKNATALANMFGAPRLTVDEGDAQKLQFVGQSCVLDVYLYPLSRGAAPSATYVNARRASDGQDVDRASCVASLRR